MNIVVYSKKNCDQCTILKEMMKKCGIVFEERNAGNLEQVRVEYEEYDEQFDFIRSFPVVIEDGNNIIGFDEAMFKYGEPILDKKNNKYTLFPVDDRYQIFYDIYKKSRASFWQVEEIDFSKDDADLLKLTQDEKYFINHIIAFFAASDGIVLENIGTNFAQEIQIQEILHAYAIQTGIEAIHSETYSLLLDRYVKDPVKKLSMFKAIENVKTIKKKAEWVGRWTDPESKSFAKRLIAFCCVEGIMFSGSFCSIYWLKERGLLPGLCFANELISRDEGLHTTMGVEIFKTLKHKPKKNEVEQIVKEAVMHEIEFVTEAFPCRLIGMNSDLMVRYIKFVADRLLLQLGYTKVYEEDCPFDFMEKISLSGKTNFFEKRVGEYAKAGVMALEEEQCFKLDEEF